MSVLAERIIQGGIEACTLVPQDCLVDPVKLVSLASDMIASNSSSQETKTRKNSSTIVAVRLQEIETPIFTSRLTCGSDEEEKRNDFVILKTALVISKLMLQSTH